MPPRPDSQAHVCTGGRAAKARDATTVIIYVLIAVAIYVRLWANLQHGYLVSSDGDQYLFEWFFAVAADSVWHLHNPLFSYLQNYPDGVNMMANTATLGLGIPLSPITLLFGPSVTWTIVLTGSLAATAAAYYWIFSRHLVRSRVAAAIGGGLCGFAPAMISHGTAHPNFVALFLIPFIVLRLIKLAQTGNPVRNGALVGLMLSYQIFLGEEVLFIGMLYFAAFALAYTVSRPREAWGMAPRFGAGILVAAFVAFVLVAYPLWWQFHGPQSYDALIHGQRGNDVAAFVRFSTESIAGDASSAKGFAWNPTEENAFFGWPLVALTIVNAIWLARTSLIARTFALSGFVMAVLSLGVRIVVFHHDTHIPGLWRMFATLPLFESLIESRLAIACIPPVGALLALATDRVLELTPAQPVRGLRGLWLGAVAAVLLPIVPTRLEVEQRMPAPEFFSSGTWQHYVDPGGSVVVAPIPGDDPVALDWQMTAGMGFPIAGGYFVGPTGPNDKRGRYGAAPTHTGVLLSTASESGRLPPIDDTDQVKTLEDLRRWRASVVILAPVRNHQALRSTLERLLNKPAQWVNGVWLWDVRGLTP